MTANPRLLFVHPTGNANARQAALAFHEAGLLDAFHTTIAWQPGSPLAPLLPSSLRAEFARRSYPDLPASKTHAHPIREMARLAAMRLGLRSLTRHETGPLSFDAVQRALEKTVARTVAARLDPDLSAVYAYDACALDIFAAAKPLGISCLYDLPIGHYRTYRRLVAEERELQPEWSPTLSGLDDSPAKLDRKDSEISLADAIFVASSFTAATLEEFPHKISAPVYRIPYGAPPPGPDRPPTRPGDPLRVLFVGQVGQRKGIGYLIQAMERISVSTALTLLGRPVATPPILEAALNRHRWIPSTPHAEVLRLMREHDVLVFPSLFEGFGLVLLEAMAQGMVVIATPHTAAPDLIEDGRDGFIVPIRSADAIAARLTQLAKDRDLLAAMSLAARQTAVSHTWAGYRQKLVDSASVLLA